MRNKANMTSDSNNGAVILAESDLMSPGGARSHLKSRTIMRFRITSVNQIENRQVAKDRMVWVSGSGCKTNLP